MKKHCQFTAVLLSLVAVFSISSSFAFAQKSADSEQVIATGNRETETKPKLDYASEQAFLTAMQQVAKNNRATLYFDRSSLSIAVQDNKTGALYFSNPYNAQKDPLYTGNIAKGMSSQLQLDYTDSTGVVQTLYSSVDCFEIGQWKALSIADGIALHLSVGKEKDKMLLPTVISAERFESKILNPLQDDSRATRRLKALYKKDGNVYRVRKLNDRETEEVERYVKKAGYTYDDLLKDNQDNNVDTQKAISPNFKLRIEYTINEQGLQVKIPADKIEFDRKNFHLISIKLLEYFGAVSSVEKHDGYILMPDGCGTLLPFQDNTPDRQSMIAGDVYGYDTSTTYPEIPRQGSQYYLPIFGIKKDNIGLFAIVTEGDALTKLSAYAGKHFGNYFAAFPTFQYTTRESLELDQKVTSHNSATTAYLYDENCYRGNYAIQYILLNEQENSYTGMANIYRSHLQKLGMQQSKHAFQTALSIETLGTVNVAERFLGIPYTSAVKLTTFEQNQKIVESVQKQGVSDVVLTLEGWRKNGLEYTAANRFDPSSALGGKAGFSKLAQWCKSNDIPLYPNLDFVFVARDRWFDGFSANKHTSRMLNDKFGGFMQIRPDTSMYDKKTFKFALSPFYYENTFQKLMKSCDKNNVNAIGLSTVGSFVSADYRDKTQVNRAQTTEILKKILKQKAEHTAFSFEGGNAYALPYASYIQKIPMNDSNYRGTVCVPFIQLVLHGVIGYSSAPINFEYDEQTALLKCIETGTSPHYLLAYDNTMKLKQTNYTGFYSINVGHWLDTAVKGYQTVNAILKEVKNCDISEHTYITENVVKVTYENGKSVLINYGADAFTVQATTIQPHSAIIVQGGAN